MSLMELTELLSGDDSSPRSSSPAVPLSAVEDLVETVVVLRKDAKTNEIGISVVGGVDTYLGCVVVEQVAEGGPAWSDGRLQRGDILLQVNDTSLVATWAEAVMALRAAASPVRLLVLREDPEALFTTTQEPTKFITVELHKSSVAERVGLSLMERRDRSGIFVTLVEPGSPAARSCRILQGDKLLEVNGSSVTCLSLHHVAAHIRSLVGRVVIVVGRVPALARALHEWSHSQPPTARGPTRLRIHTWSHSTPHTSACRLEVQDPDVEDVHEGWRPLLTGRLHTHTTTRTTRLPRPPSLLHVLRRSLRGHTSHSTRTILHRPDSPQPHLCGTEVVCTDDSESCGSDKPFLSELQVTSF
ncbi:multiple PDZ domain protein-like isoform X2 [Panulirus ornatus]|uniref:multiple PDZ domain protein-like isoform X2 n=1 Tax=Panulirus ornatus TaxID=150431 RepID=UPI003A8A5DD8